MRSRSFYPDDKTRIEIISGLLKLKAAGQFAGVDATEKTLRVQFEHGGYWKLIGWRKGWDMVQDGLRQLARLREADAPLLRKAPTSERSQRAQRARNGTK